MVLRRDGRHRSGACWSAGCPSQALATTRVHTPAWRRGRNLTYGRSAVGRNVRQWVRLVGQQQDRCGGGWMGVQNSRLCRAGVSRRSLSDHALIGGVRGLTDCSYVGALFLVEGRLLSCRTLALCFDRLQFLDSSLWCSWFLGCGEAYIKRTSYCRDCNTLLDACALERMCRDQHDSTPRLILFYVLYSIRPYLILSSQVNVYTATTAGVRVIPSSTLHTYGHVAIPTGRRRPTKTRATSSLSMRTIISPTLGAQHRSTSVPWMVRKAEAKFLYPGGNFR